MKVRIVYSVWGGDGFDSPLGGGVHELDDVTADQARSIAGAAAAGVVEVLDASDAERELLDGHVQSQEDAEAAYAAAQDVHDAEGNVVERGGWQHGNHVTFIANQKDRLAHDDLVVARIAAGKRQKGDEPLGEAERADLERKIADAEERLAGMEVPS